MLEMKIINSITKHIKRSPDQLNEIYHCDAEIIQTNGQLLAISIDDYSQEDCLPDSDPIALGWNMVIATMSDILTVGASPEFILQSLVTTDSMDQDYIEGLSLGIQKAADSLGCFVLGGDVSTGMNWRYTAVAIGSFKDKSQIKSRILPDMDHGIILASGNLGAGNISALDNNIPLKFKSRLSQSKLLHGHAAACMDTSDGLGKTIETIAKLNPRISIIIDIDSIRYAGGIKEYTNSAGVLQEAFLLGSAGEYELLAFVLPEDSLDLIAKDHFYQIGTFNTIDNPGIYYRTKNKKSLIEHIPLIDPRAAISMDDYCKGIITLSHKMFG